jgi:hypothetical protein
MNMLLNSPWPGKLIGHYTIDWQYMLASFHGRALPPTELARYGRIERMCILVSCLIVWFAVWYDMSGLIRLLAMLHAQKRV